jgi:hypothetical protein
MDSIFPEPGDIAPLPLPPTLPMSTALVTPAPAAWRRDRLDRIAALSQDDMAAGLFWLAMNFPAVCDALLDKTEFDAIDDEYPSQEPEPFWAECDSHLGIFQRFGLDWRHYRGDATTLDQIEVFHPCHAPVIAWRLPRP